MGCFVGWQRDRKACAMIRIFGLQLPTHVANDAVAN